MARNDVYLYTNATSVANAVVTSQTVTTAADFPDLVLGDTPTFNFYFTNGTASWPSFAGNAQYSVEWALGTTSADDSAVLAYQTQATAITGGWSIILPLNTGMILNMLNNARVSQEYPVVRVWQQIRVTDPDGYKTTYATIRTNLRLRTVPSGDVLPNDPLPAGYQVVKAAADGVLAAPSNFLSLNSILVPSDRTLTAEGLTTLNRVERQTTYAANYGFVHYGSTNSSGGGSLSENDIYAFGYNVGANGIFDTPTEYQLYQGFESDYVNGGIPTLEWYIRFNTPTEPGPSATHEPIFSGFNKNTNRIFETNLRGDLIQLANSDGSSPFAEFSSSGGVELFAATTVSGSFLSVTASVADDAALQIAKTFGGADGEVQRLVNITGTDLAVSATSAHYLIGAQVTAGELSIASGVTDTGYRIGLNILGHANSGTFLGTLATQIGVRTSVGILDSGSSGARTITSSTAFQAECQLGDTGTITTGYLFRGTYSGSTASVTNKWGLYITGEAKNYLSGLLQLGTVTEYANNAAAISGGLVAGQVYRTGEALKIVY